MSVSVELRLFGLTAGVLEIAVDEAHCNIFFSYLTDPVDELLRVIASLVRGAPGSVVRFEDEPGQTRVYLAPIADQIEIRAISFPNTFNRQQDKEGIEIFRATCRLRTFAGQVLAAVQSAFADIHEVKSSGGWSPDQWQSSAAALKVSLNAHSE